MEVTGVFSVVVVGLSKKFCPPSDFIKVPSHLDSFWPLLSWGSKRDMVLSTHALVCIISLLFKGTVINPPFNENCFCPLSTTHSNLARKSLPNLGPSPQLRVILKVWTKSCPPIFSVS